MIVDETGGLLWESGEKTKGNLGLDPRWFGRIPGLAQQLANLI